MMKELLAIQEELQAILKEGQATIDQYIKEVEIANLAEKQANRDYIKAKEDMNIKAYTKAAEDRRTAKDIAYLYNSKIEEIKDRPLITKEVYSEYNRRIKEVMDNFNNEGKAKASALLKELEAIGEEVVPAYTLANNLLKELQNNIYRHSAEKVMEEARENKTPLNTNELHNEYKDNSLVIGIDHILNSQATQNIKDGGNK